MILAGHQRVRTMKKLKQETEIDVRVPSRMLTEAEANEYLIRSNRNAGEWDWDILANEWEASDLVKWGFDPAEFADGIDPISMKEEGEDDDYDGEVPPEPMTKLGDIYELGDHKLICGSSTDIDVIKKICGEESVDLVLTDPPYNVDYSKKTRSKTGIYKGVSHEDIKNDSLNDTDFKEFLLKAYANMYFIMKKGCSFYVFFANKETINFIQGCENTGLKIHQTIIWKKNNFSIGRCDYQQIFEPCLYGWKEGEKHNWYSDRKQTSVIEFDKPYRNKEHPTMKPIPLFAYLINNSCKRGDIVFDFFLGSGTTLIACEQLGRVCYGVELDPGYCDVIVDRYKKYMAGKGLPYEIKKNGILL